MPVPVTAAALEAEKVAELLVLTGTSHSRKAYLAPESTQDGIFAR